MTDKNDALPHRNLLTRIKPSPKGGVGVFAIRDISEGTRLFVGDESAIVHVSVSEVERISDPEIRRVYTDFCPLHGGYYIAPADFNRMAMGWYLNHSDEPNVRLSDEMQFVALASVPAGVELTTDYTTYSNHALTHVRRWK
jgi:hypothetical protein